ncbi:MAG TPA: manganese efflux pump MntP family protein [Methanocorpusculum sp.]|nr:manganese efflux pump MntP family protein [Methanocorpusculum sp.]
MDSAALLSTLLIAVGLALDAFSVSLAGGAVLKKNIVKTALAAGGMFGFFQFIMPLIGFAVGAPISQFLQTIGNWIVVALFFFIGGKMIYDGCKGEEESVNLTGFKVLLILAIATSIDALAVGISYGLMGMGSEILLSSIIIGIVSFLFGFAGVLAGHKLSNILGSKMEIVGGVILVLIGVKFLVEIFI